MKISICIATYNGAKYIKKQLDSILKQDLSSYPNCETEIIVSDDYSKDKTIDIIKSYNDERIKVFFHKQNKKQKYHTSLYAATENFGYAMSKATGDYIFLSDQDDIWYPNKLSDALDILTKQEGVCAAAFDIMDEKTENIIGEVKYQHTNFWKLNRGFIYGFSCGISRSELKYILPMPSVPQHDVFINLMAQKRGCLHIIDKICAAHRWGEDNTSNTANKVPFFIKLLSRLKIYAIVLWRYYTR